MQQQALLLLPLLRNADVGCCGLADGYLPAASAQALSAGRICRRAA